MRLYPKKDYHWCLCGHSKTQVYYPFINSSAHSVPHSMTNFFVNIKRHVLILQPMCDGTHKNPNYKCTLKPIKFRVEEEDDYYLCNCKQTKLRPFCDGTHKTLWYPLLSFISNSRFVIIFFRNFLRSDSCSSHMLILYNNFVQETKPFLLRADKPLGIWNFFWHMCCIFPVNFWKIFVTEYKENGCVAQFY